MRVGILSDTHGYYHPDLPDVLEGMDLILHAGDVGRVAILRALEDVAPVRAVFGNVDGTEVRREAAEHLRFDVEGLSVWMTHIGGRPGRWDAGVRDQLLRDPPDLFVCGHSHILRIERVDEPEGMLFINPGAAGREGLHREKTCCRLRVEDGEAVEVDVVRLDRDGPDTA